MTAARRPGYDEVVDVLRARATRWIAAGLGVLLSCFAAPAAPAAAATVSFDVGDQAVLNVLVRGRGNDVTVRTWDRSTVQIDTADDAPPSAVRRSADFGTPNVPLVQQIPADLYTLRDGPGGAIPPEGFPYAGFRPGQHDVIRLDAPQGSRLVITVPATTGILALRIGGGRTVLEGYRGANLFVIQNQGRVQLTGATTTAFVQMNYGTFYAADGAFDRIRIRGVGATDVFERCRTKQIEATSITGSIVYDGGSFDPGLARFESQTGNIALGVTSAAQLAGRSQEGHVYTLFDRRGTYVDQHGDGDATATVGGGGPLVNAISSKGNVYFYDGTLQSRRAGSAAAEWKPLHQLYNLHRGPGLPRVERPPARHAPTKRFRF